jgi:hypothetical protein
MADADNPKAAADDADTAALRIDGAEDAPGRTAAATSPFFRLPRELRDMIYGLAALGEGTIYYNITLKADEPTQEIVCAHRSKDCAFSDSQSEVEYAASVTNRVKALLAGGDRSGSQMGAPGPPDRLHNDTQDIKLELSKGQSSDGQIGQNIHVLELFLPLKPPGSADCQR